MLELLPTMGRNIPGNPHAAMSMGRNIPGNPLDIPG